MTENWRGGEGGLVRLKVQIILCTYCLKEGEVEALSWLDGGWGGWVQKERLVSGAGRRVRGVGSWLFQHRV